VQIALVISVILLFIGIAIAPTINFNIVKASTDNDLVEVTTQACGIQGFGNTTVKLTREQYNELQQYLVEFRARLNQTSTREEAVPIFNDAVVELDKYGLLPRGMSVEKAQQLMTGSRINPLYKIVEKLLGKRNNITIINALCLLFVKWTYLFLLSQVPLWVFLLWILGSPIDFFYLILLLSAIPITLSIFSFMILQAGIGSIKSLGISGLVDYENLWDVGIFGFVGLKVLSNNGEGILLGWSVLIYLPYK
jgi:hypothetical protein